MEHKFKEIWDNLTMLSKVGIAIIYSISSFPVFFSKQIPSTGTLSFFWFVLVMVLNLLVLIWFINKSGLKWYHINFLAILLAITLYLENPEVFLLRMLFSLSLTFLIIEVVIILPLILLISLVNLMGDKVKRESWKTLFIKNQN